MKKVTMPNTGRKREEKPAIKPGKTSPKRKPSAQPQEAEGKKHEWWQRKEKAHSYLTKPPAVETVANLAARLMQNRGLNLDASVETAFRLLERSARRIAMWENSQWTYDDRQRDPQYCFVPFKEGVRYITGRKGQKRPGEDKKAFKLFLEAGLAQKPELKTKTGRENALTDLMTGYEERGFSFVEESASEMGCEIEALAFEYREFKRIQE